MLKVLIEFLAEPGPAQGTSHHVELPAWQGCADAVSSGKPLWIAPGAEFSVSLSTSRGPLCSAAHLYLVPGVGTAD